MRKPLPIQLSIPSPCSENWEAMTPDAQGRFCAHCQKSVIDFTGWSDKALHDFFSKNSSPVCGRLLSAQLNRTINIPPQPHSKLYRIAIALGLTILVAQAHDVQARVQPPLTEQNILTAAQSNDSTGADSVTIKGQVLDEKKQPMPGAVVELRKSGIMLRGIPTDIDGLFDLNVPRTTLQDNAIELTVSCNGYNTVAITHISTDIITIQLVPIPGFKGSTITTMSVGIIALPASTSSFHDPFRPMNMTISDKDLKHSTDQ